MHAPLKKLIILMMTGLLLTQMEAQTKRPTTTSRKPVKKEWTDNLWYGGGFNLGFYGSSLAGLGGNVFFVGVSPMVGYKLLPNLSAGPRLEVNYTTGRYSDNFNGQIYKYNSITLGGGAFTRLKFLKRLFTHAEYSYLSRQNPVNIDYNRQKILFEREGDQLLLLGAGYTSGMGSGFGSEIYILYDVLEDNNTIQLPIQYRFGLTYNF